MAENSKIEWTKHTFNPWIGCTKVHTGCANCYAENLMDHRYGKAKWGPHGTRVRTSDANWRKPLQWDRAAAKSGERHRVFCASLADIFEDWQGRIVNSSGETLHRGEDWQSKRRYVTPGLMVGKSVATMDDLRADLFRLIDATPHLDWLLLTKRPENVLRMWPRGGGLPLEYRDNVWLGTSISDQPTANNAVPRLLQCRDLSPVLFLSAEPIVGPVDLTDIPDGDSFLDALASNKAAVDWVIAGGESGHNARPMHTDWARSLRDQCAAAGVPFFHKQ